jgi:hypothetical protein
MSDTWKGESLIRGQRPSPKTAQTAEASHASKVVWAQRRAAGKPVEQHVKHARWYRWAVGFGK